MGKDSLNTKPEKYLREACSLINDTSIARKEKMVLYFLIETSMNLVRKHYLDTREFIHFVDEAYGEDKTNDFVEMYFNFNNKDNDENP